MFLKFLKRLYHLFNRILIWIKRRSELLLYFILPNLTFLFSGRFKKGNFPICDQKTLLTVAGTIEIGRNCLFGYKPGGFHRGGFIEFQPRYKNAAIKIGDNVATNNNIFICAANRIEIGDDTLIGQNVTIMDFEAQGIPANKRRELGPIGEVKIGKNVWIGNNVTILKNSEIGENTIVAAGAVLSGKFPADVIVGGVPAKIVKSL
jgi:acetyltransferase-like isoleucine patch superfamily enzyme